MPTSESLAQASMTMPLSRIVSTTSARPEELVDGTNFAIGSYLQENRPAGLNSNAPAIVIVARGPLFTAVSRSNRVARARHSGGVDPAAASRPGRPHPRGGHHVPPWTSALARLGTRPGDVEAC